MVDYIPSFSLPWFFVDLQTCQKIPERVLPMRGSLKIAPLLLPFNKAALRMLTTTVFFSSSGTYSLFKENLSTVALKNL